MVYYVEFTLRLWNTGVHEYSVFRDSHLLEISRSPCSAWWESTCPKSAQTSGISAKDSKKVYYVAPRLICIEKIKRKFFFGTPCIISFNFIISEPQTQAAFLLLLLLHFVTFFTSITQSFLKLEHFLRPYLKTRSHDGSAHTSGSSLRFLEVPQKGVLKN